MESGSQLFSSKSLVALGKNTVSDLSKLVVFVIISIMMAEPPPYWSKNPMKFKLICVETCSFEEYMDET